MRRIAFMMVMALFFGCVSNARIPGVSRNGSLPAFVSDQSESTPTLSPEVLKDYESELNKQYLIGPGDKIEIISPTHQEVSGIHTVGPDGTIAVPLTGETTIAGLSRTQAEDLIKQKLDPYFTSLGLTLKITDYVNNRVFVLGRVERPGAIRFEGKPTLLEALSIAGPFPPVQEAAFLSKCSIFRGRNQIIWIDLQELLSRGNVHLNLRLANNDVIYIPDPQGSNVYIFGEVKKPGVYKIKDMLTLLNALTLAEGLTENAVDTDIKLIRDREKGGGVTTVDLKHMFATADFTQNYLLKNNDILYVPRKGIAAFNYYLRMLSPFIQWITVGAAVGGN